MSARWLLVTPILAALLWGGAEKAAEAAAEPAAAAPAPESEPGAAPAPEPARRTVQVIYDALARGDPAALADAIDAAALLEQSLAGLSARPSAVWRAAALARLDASRRNLAEVVAGSAFKGLARALAEQPGPDGATAVAVRLYQQDGRPVWHRLLLRKQAAAWRVVEIEMLAAGEESGADLSNLALAVLFDSNVKALPDEAGSQALALPAGELLGALLAGILLGLALHRLGRRPLPDGKLPGALSGASFWLPTVAGLAAGLVLFGLGLSRYLHEHGAVEELKAHGLSLARLQDGDLEGALKAWPQNQAAQVRKAEVLASMGKPEDAQRYLAALAQTKTPPPAVYLNLARLQQRGERPAEAAASLGKFGDLLGGDALIYIQAAQQAARGRDFRLADELLRRAQAVEPPDAVMLLARASIHAAERRPAEVIADFKAVLGQGAAQPRDLLLLIERTPDFDPVRNDPAFVKFVKGLAGGEAPPAVGPVRRNP